MEQTNNNTVSPDENINKVRELLFGTEIKRHQADIEGLKGEFENKLTEFKKQVNTQIDSIKSLLSRQTESLTQMIQKIESSSDEKFVLAGKKIAEANERNLKTFESLSQSQSKEIAELEKTLNAEIEKVAADTQRDITILREIKLNRSMLGKFFQEAADKLQTKK